MFLYHVGTSLDLCILNTESCVPLPCANSCVVGIVEFLHCVGEICTHLSFERFRPNASVVIVKLTNTNCDPKTGSVFFGMMQSGGLYDTTQMGHILVLCIYLPCISVCVPSHCILWPLIADYMVVKVWVVLAFFVCAYQHISTPTVA